MENTYKLKIPKKLNSNENTISSEIELVGCKGEMYVKSISRFIDYSIPEKHKVKIELSTVFGDVYSNIKFDNKFPENI